MSIRLRNGKGLEFYSNSYRLANAEPLVYHEVTWKRVADNSEQAQGFNTIDLAFAAALGSFRNPVSYEFCLGFSMFPEFPSPAPSLLLPIQPAVV